MARIALFCALRVVGRLRRTPNLTDGTERCLSVVKVHQQTSSENMRGRQSTLPLCLAMMSDFFEQLNIEISVSLGQ